MNISTINQDSELAKVKEKIRKIASKTTNAGATEHEANSAMKKVGELLDHYDLELNDILLQDEECVSEIYHLRGKSRSKFDCCVPAIAQFCDCIVYFSSVSKDEKGYVFFGLKSDTQMALHLCYICERAIEWELAMYKVSDPIYNGDKFTRRGVSRKTLSTNFYKGMSIRLSQRLKDLKRQRDNELYEKEQHLYDKMNNVNALVSIRDKKNRKVKEEFKKTGVNIYSHRSKSRYNSDARNAGMKAGDKVNLSRPINSGNQRLLK